MTSLSCDLGAHHFFSRRPFMSLMLLRLLCLDGPLFNGGFSVYE